MNLTELWEQIKSLVERQADEIERKIKEVDSWSGAASNYASTADYCDACLINTNAAAGKTKREDWTQDHCMLPVKEPGDSMMADKGIMAAAGGRGISRVKKPSDVSQEDWDKAVKGAAGKLASAYKEMDMDVPPSVEAAKERAISMDTLQTMAYRASYDKYPAAYVHSVYIDDAGAMFVILSQDMKLYRSELMFENGELMLSDWIEVTQEFPPKTRTQIIRQQDGKVRWLSISATATINRCGEIDSRALFDSFVKHAEETGKYPVRRFFHLDDDRWVTGQADFLARAGNCYITSGFFNDTPLAQDEIKAREKDPDGWGDSIGYIPLDKATFIKVRGMDIPVYQDGINVEISTLPQREAASLFVKTEVKRQMNEKKLRALADLSFAGDIEKARKWLEENPEEVNRQIEQNGLITRATDPSTGSGQGEGGQIELTEELVTVIVQRMAELHPVQENEVIRTLQTTVTEQASAIATLRTELDQVKASQATLDTRIKPLEKDTAEIERQARLDAPANGVVKVGFKPSVERSAQQEAPSVTGKELAEATLDKIGLKY